MDALASTKLLTSLLENQFSSRALVFFLPYLGLLLLCCVYGAVFYSCQEAQAIVFATFVRLSDCSYHMVGAISDGLVPQGRDALLGVAVTGAAALHDQVINGKVLAGKRLVGGAEVFGLAGTRLMPQQANSDVGDFQLLLALVSEGVQGLPLWKAAVDHL